MSQRSNTDEPENALLDVLDGLDHLEEERIPITRLPYFDIYTHNSDLPLRAAADSTCRFPLRWGGGLSCSSGAALLYLRRYVNFVSGLIDQDSVSIWCSIGTVVRKWSGIIVAERPLDSSSPCHLRIVEPIAGSTTPVLNVTDFSFQFSSIGEWMEQSPDHLFSITAAPKGCHLWVSRDRLPEAAVKSFLDELQGGIPEVDRSTKCSSGESMSVLNWHATEHQPKSEEPASASLLHEMFEVQAKQIPDHCAIEFLHPEHSRESPYRLESWTYKELNARCDSVAKQLKAVLDPHHLRPSQPCVVPVFLATSPELYISYLAILKAGYAFCPLPMDAPIQRLRDILDDIQPSVALGIGPAPDSGPWAEVSRAFNIKWLDLQLSSACHDKSFASHPTPDSLAYLMYTSGSTGRPKGVQITHHAATASIIAHIKQCRDTISKNMPMRWCQFAAPTFDPSIMEIFVTLCSGGTLCSAPREMMLSSPEVVITETRSTIMMATPGFASMLDIDRIPTLSCLWTMGEMLNRKVIDCFAYPEKNSFDTLAKNGKFPRNLYLCNAYGPTEAAVNVTFFPNVPQNARGSIIGYPLETNSILIIDTRFSGIRAVPIGFVGELVIGGSQVSIGYLQRPNENSAAFVTDERYGKLYRTGDRARIVWDPKGVPTLEYLGRISDDQVKVNGQRIELGEIESTLCTVADIRSAVATIDKSNSNVKNRASLVACLLLEPMAKTTIESIKENCRKTLASRLPLHMQPARLICVDKLPRTAAGKVDRQEMSLIALKQHDSELSPSDKKDGKSLNVSERASRSVNQGAIYLLSILEDALQKTVGPMDSSREDLKYWLDSLSALRFLRKIRDQGIKMLSLKDILHARSIGDLAQVASERSNEQRLDIALKGSHIPASLRAQLDGFRTCWQGAGLENLGIELEDVSDILPTTITQDRLLLSFSKAHHEPMKQRNYVHHSIHMFAPGTEIRKLKAAWSNVINRHDVYHTMFSPVDDDLSSFAQVVLSPDCRFSQSRWIERTSTIESVDSNSADVISAIREAETIIALENPTPVLTLLRTPKNLSVVLSMLHAIFDLSSLQLLLEEIAAEMGGKPAPFRTELRLAVETYFASQVNETDAFWNDYMNAYEPSTFPFLTGLRPEATLGSTTSSQITSTLTMGNLEKQSKNLLCSPLSALQAAWSSILLAYTSPASGDVAFGSLFAGRSDAGGDVCMAPAFSIAPTRMHLERSSLNIDILRALTGGNSRARYHLYPSPRSKGTCTTSYDTTIALQFIQHIDSCRDVLQNTEMLPMAHDYAVMIEAIPDASDRIFLKATYSDLYLDQRSAGIMLSQLDEILVWILANPMLPYHSSLGCLKVENLSILNPCPRTKTTTESSLLHTQFELNALEHADRTALEFHHSLQDIPGVIERWSYRELNSEANKLAIGIRSRFGNVTGAIIPILMEKQPKLYIAVLGVLKAGAAWSPIDTNSPAKRRLELIARLGSKMIIVSEDTVVDKAGIPTGVEVLAMPTKNRIYNSRNQREKSHKQGTTPDFLAYLIWTSGTTGVPKGVPISHGAASISMNAIQAAIPCTTTSGSAPRCLQFSQHTFDVFVQDLFYTWGVGGTVVSANREIMTTSFADLSRVTKASHAFLTPAFAANVSRGSCPTLEVITMIGEKLPQHVADDWGRDIKAYNTYGPAEATVVSTLTEFSGSGKYIKSSNIGRPLPSLSCYVLRDGKEVMIQGVGELALSGPQLAKGYLMDPAMTSAKFIKYGESENMRYFTGDVVRQLADGTLDFIGREDDLVKLGGIRVELSEISFAMKDCHKKVHQIETCYFGRSDRTKAVVSFIATNLEHENTDLCQSICTPESAETARCAMSQAKLNLPRYMIPSTIVILPKIPNTSSAKVDRKALKKAYDDLDLESWEAATSAGRFEVLDNQELSDDQLKVRRCLSDFCDVPVETINLHSSLNSLGIDSLSAARFVHRLTKLGICLQLTDVLQSQTVCDVARFVKRDDQKDIIQNNSKFAAKEFSDAWQRHAELSLGQGISFAMPTTPLQEGVLSESMFDKSSYWSNHLFELKPNVEIDRLRLAWDFLCSNTQALRTSFVTLAEVASNHMLPRCPSSFLQVICNEEKVDWAEVDVDVTLRDTAQERFDRIISFHQTTTFCHPPWALTIIAAESCKHMMLTIHHAIHDAESVKFIISDLASAYSTFSVPKRHQITDALPASIDYNTGICDEKYWRNILLPYKDVAFSTWPNLVGAEESASKAISRSMISETYELNLGSDEISHGTRALDTTFSVISKVAFGCLLLNYLETSSIVFAEIVSQRILNPQFRDAIAPLVATMPVPFAARQTARELLSEQSRQATESWAHGSPSGPLVRRNLRCSPHQPLYPAFFVFHARKEESDGKSDSQPALWCPGEEFLGLSTEHDLSMNVYLGDRCTIELIASDRIMHHDSLKTFCRQIESLIKAIFRSPDRPLLGLLDDADQHIISLSESRLPKPMDHPCNLYPNHWLEYHAQYHADWNAIEIATDVKSGFTETETWTFSRLFLESHKIANFIKGRGHSDEIIAMCTGRTLQSYAIIVGILMSGNTYLPIDDGLPQHRKLLLLEDSNCALLFTDRSCVKVFGCSSLKCAIIDVDNASVAQEILQTREDACARPIPSASAYLLYTSGSTGKPKGVLISHMSLCGFIEGLTNYMGHCSGHAQSQAGVGKWLGLASRAFDVHLAEMFLAWRSGLTAVTAPRESLLDDLRLALTSLKVTHAICVPSLLEQAGLTPDQLPDLVFLTIGGEKISQRIVDTWADHPRVTAVNAYGPTELAIGCSASHIVPNFNVSNIGFPYGETGAHILIPETDHYATRGQAGELCFTGCLVGNGYLNRPEAKGFVDFRGQRMYRTGDMARMLPDGSLVFLGRRDDQTKLRGQRVELSEISESIRTSSEDAIEVITLLLGHPVLPGTFLTSFVSDWAERAKRYDAKLEIIDDRLGEFTHRIRDHCSKKLPSYMVPDYIIPVNITPLAIVSGKADVKTLKAFFASLSTHTLLGAIGGVSLEKNQRKLSQREQQVAAVIKNTLRLEDLNSIQARTNLFALGLDSLNAVGLMVKLREIGLQCSLIMLLGNPTVESIVSLGEWSPSMILPHQMSMDGSVFRALRNEVLNKDDFHISSDAVEKILPCLPMQESTITSTLNSRSSIAYINHVVFELQQDIDTDRFKKAWSDLIDCTPILRTVFLHHQDSFVQAVIRPQMTSSPWIEDPAPNLLSEVRKGLSHDIANAIEKRPLLRLHLEQTTYGPRIFSMAIHHALYDGRSFELMMEDLWLCYQSRSIPPRGAFETLLEFHVMQDVSLQESFWTRYLAKAHPSRCSKNTTVRDETSASLYRPMKFTLSEIQQVANKSEVTLATLSQCIFAIALARKIKVLDVIFGSILSGRSVPVIGAESIRAPCINTLPQRIQFQCDELLSQVISRFQSTSTKCLEHQHTSLREISRWTRLEQPMFDALFSFSWSAAQEQDTRPWIQVESSMVLGYPLAVGFIADRTSDTLAATCEYTCAFGANRDAESLVNDVEILLTMMVNGENPSVSGMGIIEQNFARSPKVKPWDETNWSADEIAIRDVLHDLTGIASSSITKNASFFQLGVDSVTAIALAKSLRLKQLSVRSSDVMLYPCIGSLGHYLLGQSKRTFQKVDPMPITTQESLWALVRDELKLPVDSLEAVYPCTPLQAGMLTSTLASEGDAYTYQHDRILPAEVNIERFREAWTMTVQSLDILRTSFHYSNTEGSQWIACVYYKMTAEPLERRQISHASSASTSLKLFEEDDFRKPPFLAKLLQDGNRIIFQLTLHHALYDGISLPMVFERLSINYRDSSLSLEVTKVPSFYYGAQVIQKQARLSVSFWLNALEGYHNPSKHVSSDITPRQRFSTRNCRTSLETLVEGCKVLSVTLQTLLLTAYSKVLAVVLQRRDFAFGHVVSGRSLPIDNCDSIIGPLFNTVPMRIRFDRLLASNMEVMNQIQDLTINAQAHQHTSLAQVQDEWRKKEDHHGIRLFDSLFLFQKVASITQEAFLRPLGNRPQAAASEYCLNLEIEQGQTELTLSASCHERCLVNWLPDSFLDMYEEVLGNLLSCSEQAFGSHPQGLAALALKIPRAEADRTLQESNKPKDELNLLKIKNILAKVAKVPAENIGATVSIFALGLTSLSAIAVAVECRREGLDLGVVDVLQGLTARGICNQVARKTEHRSETKDTIRHIDFCDLLKPPVTQDCIESILPALSGQIYHLHGWLKSARTMYMPTWTYTCSRLDPNRLENAWILLRQRHPILRTTFSASTSTGATQIILKPSIVSKDFSGSVFETLDLSMIQQFIKEEQSQEIDMKAPPTRLRLIQGPSQDVILVTIHHALYDAISLPLIMTDLAKLYRGMILDNPPNWQHFVDQCTRNVKSSRRSSFWKQALNPFDHTFVNRLNRNTATSTVLPLPDQTFISLPQTLTNISRYTLLSRSHNISLSTLFLLSFARSLSTLTHTTNPIFGIFTLGRSASSFPGLSHLAGPCLNVLPIVVRTPKEEPWYVKAQEIQMQLATRIPYEQDALPDVLERMVGVGHGEEVVVPFNAFVNILWHEGEQKEGREHGEGEDEGKMFKVLSVGVPSDFVPERKFEKGETGLEALRWPRIVNGVFVDIALSRDGESVDVGARIEGEIIGEEEAREWLRGIGEGVRGMLKGA